MYLPCTNSRATDAMAKNIILELEDVNSES